MPVDGPERWMSTTTSGSSVITARPSASCFSTMPGPLVVVTARCPRERGADRRADRRDLVLGLERLHAEVPEARHLVQHVARGRDRIGAEEDRPIHLHARGNDAPRERGVAGDVPVRARAGSSRAGSRTSAGTAPVVSPNA
jgi:hypothetical protein